MGFLFLLQNQAISQNVPQGISYQAVARNSDGEPLNDAEVQCRLSIRSESISGIIQWQEEHLAITDQFGLFSLIIGQGVSTGSGLSSDFEDLPWSSFQHFLQVDLEDEDGVYQTLGTMQFLSVPYAMHAATADDVDDNDANPNNEKIDSFTFNNDELSIIEEGDEFLVDLGPRLEELSSGQSINLLQLVGDSLNIVEGSESYVLDLSSLSDEDWESTPDEVYNLNQDVGVGTDSPQSTLHVQGSFSSAIDQLVGPVVVTLNENQQVILANVTSGNVVLNLPSAATCLGRQYTIKTMGPEGLPLTSACTITTTGSESIDNNPGYEMSGFVSQFITIVSDGSNWWIINEG